MLPIPSPRGSLSTIFRSRWVRLAAVALGYLALARLGVVMAYHGQDASLVWPAHGFALAALLLGGVGMWPGIAAAVLASSVWSGSPLPFALAVTVGNTLGPVVGALLLRDRGFGMSLERSRDVGALVLMAGTASSVIAATVGVATLWLRGAYPPESVPTHWVVWWTGDMTGLVTTAPLLLVWARPPAWLNRRGGTLEFWASMALVVVACLIAFGWVTSFDSQYPLAYLIFPVAIWIAVWFQQHGAVSLTAIVSITAIWQTLNHAGPFARPTAQQTLMHLQAFVAVVAISTLLLATMISERRRSERTQRRLLRAERRARQDAQRAVAAREKALAVASHEIRNPLATVLLNSSALVDAADEASTDPYQLSALRSIVVSAEQIDHVVRDLSDITRLEAGQISLQRSPCCPALLMRQARELLGALAEERGLELRVDPARELPPVLAQPERVQQVIGNLVGNAIRLSPPGSCISLSAHTGEGEVWIAVRDSGPGMPAEQVHQLLRPFWDSPLHPSGGRGLGIPIARAIVAAHGGRFRIENELDPGCRISFSLPLAQAGEPVRPPAAPAAVALLEPAGR